MGELTVDWLLPEGDGGARTSDGVLRLPGALPGERVRWRADGGKGSRQAGVVEAILSPSPLRRTPPCPFDAECGGCGLAHLAPEGRPEVLSGWARRAWRVPEGFPVGFVASPRASGHRARIKLTLDGGRVGYRREGSHALVPIDHCLAARPEVDAAIARLEGVPLAGLATVEIRSDGARVVFAFTSAGRFDGAALAPLVDVAVDGKVFHGNPTLTLPGGLRASPSSFYQVNLEVNARLVAHVRDAVLAAKAERVADLYAGIGNLTLPIAAAGVPVIAVEREGQATADLRFNAAAARLANVVTVERPVEAWDPSREAFDVVVLDPPRTGAPGVLTRVLRNRPRVIVTVSCHAPSSARDLEPALKAGYEIVSLDVFDLFPDTHHFESIVVARRKR